MRQSDPPVSLPARSTISSSDPSPLSLLAADRDRLNLRAKAEEREIYQFVVSCLTPVVAQPMTFAEMRVFERERDCTFLGKINGEIWYLPNSTTPEQVQQVTDRISPQQHDSEGIRLAIYQLWLTTRHEKMSPDDRDDMLRIYLTNLCSYPEQAVRAVLNHFAATAIFFPTWAEIDTELQTLFGWRARLITALRSYVKVRKARA